MIDFDWENDPRVKLATTPPWQLSMGMMHSSDDSVYFQVKATNTDTANVIESARIPCTIKVGVLASGDDYFTCSPDDQLAMLEFVLNHFK